MDYPASHDLEDFVAIIEDEGVVRQIEQSSQAVRDYLSQAVHALLAKPQFLDVLTGFVMDQERVF